MKLAYKIEAIIMTDLQYAITKAIPSTSCAQEMINITSRRIWLEREILILAQAGKLIEQDATTKS